MGKVIVATKVDVTLFRFTNEEGNRMKRGNGLTVYETDGARLCLLLAMKKLNEGDIDMAIHRAEETIRLLKELQNTKTL